MVLKKYSTRILFIVQILGAISLSSCNQEDFFEKEFLPGFGVPDPDSNVNPGPTSPTSPDDQLCPSGDIVTVTDQFVQNSSTQADVDILWVIDNSGSMQDEQAQLANNFEAFITDFLLQGINFQMAITTTDARSGIEGEVIGDPTLLTSVAAAQDEALFIQNFQNMIQVGTRGSGREQGIRTSNTFLNQNHHSFLRENAYLIVVYVSDEEDQSPLSVPEYINNLTSFKNNAGLVRAFSIIKTDSTNLTGTESVGSRYIEISDLTGGSHANIDLDFHNTLLDLGTNILNLLESFSLSQNPIEGSLSVKVNSAPELGGWDHNLSNNTVQFDENSLPQEGSQVEVTYQSCQTRGI